jgi:hypothetical protein
MTSGDTTLARQLGPLDAAVIVIADVIGVGIFTTPRVVATIVPAAILGVWLVGGALRSSERWHMEPRRGVPAGGEYATYAKPSATWPRS